MPREGLELVGTDFIHESVTFSPRQGSKLDHTCFGIVRGRVYSRVGGSFVNTEGCFEVGTWMFRN